MSAPKRPSDDQDPDYVSPGPTNAKQQKIFEDTARANTANKIIGIVEKEFTKEIDDKEKEVLEIQNRLQKALKTLHLLRYVVITDFYNRKQCQAAQSALQTGEITKQTQIHPAIKRLIGKTPRKQRGVGLEDPGPSTSKNYEEESLENLKDNKEGVKIEIEKRLGIINSGNDNDRGDNSKEKIDISIEKDECCGDDPPKKKIPRYIPPRSNIPIVNSPSRGVRHKVRKRIVVGNISKWIPPDWREDGASHKWMMYVRGSKDDPDIYDFVNKVRFFLHPSYQPNDVVQVTSPPFHLSRRGWGEFPLRVQLHFKNVLNKPMDIIHHLKLDRTYTGLQTLGSETVVDIWIHTSNPHNFKKNLDLKSEIRSNEIQLKLENDETDLSSIKKEFSEGSEPSDNNFTNILQNAVKSEPIENRRNSDPTDNDNSQLLLNENCIKIEHNYVCNKNLEGAERPTEIIVHSMENNITIKHSSDEKIERTEGNETGNSTSSENTRDLKIEKKNMIAICKESQPVTSNEKIKSPQKSGDDFCSPETTSNGLEGIESMNNKEVKNLQNCIGGGGSPIPIKLVKCNDKFFFMTGLGKSINNQVDFVKLANSDIVKNILSKRIQPTKVSVLSNSDNIGSKRIIPAAKNKESLLLNGEKKKGLSIKSEDSVVAGKEFLIKEDTNSNDRDNKEKSSINKNNNNNSNSQQLEMQRLASSLKSIPSKSEPLRITIPPPFEIARKKQILVLKNSKLISVNASTVNMNSSITTKTINSKEISSRSATSCLIFDKNQETKKIVCNNVLESRSKSSFNLNSGVKVSEGTSLLKPSISILKKPTITNNLGKLEQNKTVKTVFKINPKNSLLLNSNSNIPALQIAPPAATPPLLQNYQNDKGRDMILLNRNIERQILKVKRLPKNVKIDDQDDCSKNFKVSVTLGKDKQKILSRRDDYEDVLRSIETVEIEDTIGTLRFIMKRIPLITEEARDSDYKQIHPYACYSQEEFFNFHLGKQRAHEWYRAKMVRSLLKKKGFANERLWSVKEIFNFARMHGYTPVQTSLAIGNSNKTSKKVPDVNNIGRSITCTESLQFNEWIENCKDINNSNDDSDLEIDVVHIAESKVKTEIKTEPIELPEDIVNLEIDPPLQLPCAFVNETAREIGVKLQKEEIIPGVMDSSAERMIAKAMQCLVDDIVRRSLAKGWERNSNKCPDTIILDDVKGALLGRNEFDLFTNEGLGSLQNLG